MWSFIVISINIISTSLLASIQEKLEIMKMKVVLASSSMCLAGCSNWSYQCHFYRRENYDSQCECIHPLSVKRNRGNLLLFTIVPEIENKLSGSTFKIPWPQKNSPTFPGDLKFPVNSRFSRWVATLLKLMILKKLKIRPWNWKFCLMKFCHLIFFIQELKIVQIFRFWGRYGPKCTFSTFDLENDGESHILSR
jgi:hypothetical protein